MLKMFLTSAAFKYFNKVVYKDVLIKIYTNKRHMGRRTTDLVCLYYTHRATKIRISS